MEQSKLKEAILKFNGRYSKDRTVFLFDAAGKSMQLLIFEDDEIAIEKITCDRIRTGDIIAWKSYESEIEEPLLHRVICRKKTEGGYRFLTKGDWRIWHDRHWITPDEILGRVKSVRRGGHLLVIDTRIGGIISLTVGLISLICVMIKEPFNALYSKMRGIYNAAFPWHRKYRGGIFLNGYNGFPETEDWMKAVEEFEQQRPINEKGNIKIADANPGCGYSEEALRLMRKGFDVTNADLLRTDPSFDSAFDYVLIVRYINLLPARMRHKTYRRAFDLLKKGGKLVLSCRNIKTGMLAGVCLRLKNSLGGYFKKNRFELADENMLGSCYVEHNYDEIRAGNEIAGSSFRVLSALAKNDSVYIIAEKQV